MSELRVLPRDAACVAMVAYMDEVLLAVHRIHDAELARDIPSMVVVREAGRIETKAAEARAQYLALIPPVPA